METIDCVRLLRDSFEGAPTSFFEYVGGDVSYRRIELLADKICKHKMRVEMLADRVCNNTFFASDLQFVNVNKTLNGLDYFNSIIKEHDNSKLTVPFESAAYYLRYFTVCSLLPPRVFNLMLLGVYRHIKNNTHHPEFWDDDVTFQIYKRREAAGVPYTVNATEMSKPCLYAMCCDWCAVGLEVRQSKAATLSWAKVVSSGEGHFAFTPEQQELILKVITTIYTD